MEISHEEGMRKFEEMKKKSKEETDKQIKALGISMLDKGLKEEIRRLLRDKEIVQKTIELDFMNNRKVNTPDIIQTLDKIDSRIEYYVSLGQINKQHRINKLLLFIAIINLLLVSIQIYFGYLMLKN